MDSSMDLRCFCMELFVYGSLCICDFEYGYKFVQFLGFSEEFILTLDLLKVGLVIPYFVQDELGILHWVWILGVRCMDTGLGVRKLT